MRGIRSARPNRGTRRVLIRFHLPFGVARLPCYVAFGCVQTAGREKRPRQKSIGPALRAADVRKRAGEFCSRARNHAAQDPRRPGDD
jgi:hypothetical protein